MFNADRNTPLNSIPIVVADDDPAILRLLDHQLTKEGFTVRAFEDGYSAFEAIREYGEGILISDWDMPGLNGPDLCRAIRELEKLQSLRCVRVILLTGQTDKDKIVEGLEAGADDYVTKPHHQRELLARVRAGERALQTQRQLHQQQFETQRAYAEVQSLNARLHRLASTDTLTGLANRRVVFERFTQLWAQSIREKQSLGCVMIDIDHFKSINDTHGHHIGDAALVEVAQRLRNAVRPYDLLGRFGGEEFICVCPNTSAEDLGAIAERIRLSVEHLPVAAEDVILNCTVSIGAASRRDNHAAPDMLINEADRLLYQSKANGRNQVWYQDPDGNDMRWEAPLAPLDDESGPREPSIANAEGVVSDDPIVIDSRDGSNGLNYWRGNSDH